ncbi:MAG: type II toxin-antitoxin system Phd/YefM family antitoxin [Candidatus Hydrogenedentes bacterium]|nr:type II toxin-antitoxin system Phd/YefM family antitoxin [Candidatus Hydrogenedentota bacterium]
MMKTVTVTEIRRNDSRLLDLVEGGETLLVQRRGKAVARIAPALSDEDFVPSWKRPRQKLALPGVDVAKMIIEDRR